MNTHTKLGRCLDRLSVAMMALAMLFLAAMAVLMNVEILGRTLFRTSTMIADEYSGYFFCWLFLCALTYVQRQGGLLKVEILTNRLSGRPALALEVFASLACALLTAILAWTTWETVISSLDFGSTSLSIAETPLWIPQLIMPLGLGIVTLSFLETAYSRLHAFLEGDSASGGAA